MINHGARNAAIAEAAFELYSRVCDSCREIEPSDIPHAKCYWYQKAAQIIEKMHFEVPKG